MAFFIGHDLGTGADKAVLVDARGRLVAEHVASYPLYHPEPGWAEQDAEDWWRAVCTATRAVLERAGLAPSEVAGLAFAGQMLSLAALRADGSPTRRPIVWMDGRAGVQARRLVRRFGGERILFLLAGGAPTGKDLVAKIAWLSEHEPDVYRETAFFTDATGYLVARATGAVHIDPTAAGATGMLDLDTRRWSRLLAWLTSFPLDKLPPLVASTAIAGHVTARAAAELGLAAGTPVAMGMADVPSAAIGSGAVLGGDAHVYLGTSAWIGVTVDKPRHVPRAGIASVPSAAPTGCLVVGESETAGACRAWFEAEIGTGSEAPSLDALAARAEPGARGLLFLPWMYGERAPVPDHRVRGAFVNLSLEHERRHLMRAVYEGVALNLRWILEACAGAGEACPTLRAIGGGAQSDLWLQILADVTERPIERVAEPHHAGAIGCALVAAVATGALGSVAAIKDTVRIERRFVPERAHAAVYREAFAVFRELHGPLSRAGRLLEGRSR
ncbi:MAG: FGGY-family carbohydrate kinase [Polyangiaceae bacterium]|nr:FGGY-family carbohydrate kinase [Polyangiaceae bacterium]